MAQCMAREAIYTGAYLGTMPALLAALSQSEQFKDSPHAAFTVAGISCGLGAVVATQPLDTIKTRIQANLGPEGAAKYSGTAATAKAIAAESAKGYGELFSGLV